MSDISLEQQLRCAQREVRQRERVYTRLVLADRMTPQEADEEIASMQAIMVTLERLVAEEQAQQQPSLFGEPA